MALAVKNLTANAANSRDVGSIPGSRRAPGEGNGNPLQYSCLGNPMDRGAGQAVVLGVAKNWTRLSTPHAVEALAPSTVFLFFTLAVQGLHCSTGASLPQHVGS